MSQKKREPLAEVERLIATLTADRDALQERTTHLEAEIESAKTFSPKAELRKMASLIARQEELDRWTHSIAVNADTSLEIHASQLIVSTCVRIREHSYPFKYKEFTAALSEAEKIQAEIVSVHKELSALYVSLFGTEQVWSLLRALQKKDEREIEQAP